MSYFCMPLRGCVNLDCLNMEEVENSIIQERDSWEMMHCKTPNCSVTFFVPTSFPTLNQSLCAPKIDHTVQCG